jgi:exodeoxyribonuclease VIII
MSTVNNNGGSMKIITYEELTPELARAGCLVTGMPNDAYHAYEGISKSGLDLIARSPAHYAYRTASEPSRAMVIGSATHAAILEPEQFDKQYMLLRDVTDRRSSVYKQAAEQFGADNVLTGTEADAVIGMRESVRLNSTAVELLDAEGYVEIAAFATDPITGVLVKCKFDKLLKDLRSVDLKTTQDLRDFAKSVANYRYHVQQAYYSDVFAWATGLQLESFDFLAVEKDAPNASRLFRLDTPSIDYGRKLYRQALDLYAECLSRNEWPMPSGETEYITLPSWAADPDLQGDY